MPTIWSLPLLSLLSLAAPIAFLVVSLRRKRGSGDGSSAGDGLVGGRHTSGGQPAPGSGYTPDPRFGGGDTAFPPTAAVATSVLAPTVAPPGASSGFDSGGFESGSFESGGFVPASVPSTFGDPFPTTRRAIALLGGHALTGFGILILLLSAKPAGHHEAHIGNGAIGLLGFLIAFVGASSSLPATSRIQRDVMGGGWNSRVALGYISPQISLYAISPAGISDASRRLNIAPGLAMLVIYGLGAADVLLIAAHYFGH